MVDVETKILDVIYNCGGITKRGIEMISGLEDDSVLRNLLDKKVLKKQPITIGDKTIALYTVTSIGEEYYIEKTGRKHFYRCSRGEKVVALSYFYISEIDKIDDWKNKDEWYADGESGKIPDATYTEAGETFALAVIRPVEKERAHESFMEFSVRHGIKQIKLMAR